jgi:hypothetical protein
MENVCFDIDTRQRSQAHVLGARIMNVSLIGEERNYPILTIMIDKHVFSSTSDQLFGLSIFIGIGNGIRSRTIIYR